MVCHVVSSCNTSVLERKRQAKLRVTSGKASLRPINTTLRPCTAPLQSQQRVRGLMCSQTAGNQLHCCLLNDDALRCGTGNCKEKLAHSELRFIDMKGGYRGVEEHMADPREALADRTTGQAARYAPPKAI